jgi:hypothetical protein
MTMKKLMMILVAAAAMQLQVQAKEQIPAAKGIENLEVQISGNTLTVNWKDNSPGINHWVIQGSTDGVNFSTLGLVLGENPVKPGEFSFKDNMQPSGKPMKYFRVVEMINENTGLASEPVSLHK